MEDTINRQRAQDFPLDVCPVCGKRFYKTPQWIYKLVYKKKIRVMCSYGCYRALEKKKDAELKARRKKKGVAKK